MTKTALLLSLAVATTVAADEPRQFDGATPLEWSRRLADSEMKRLGTSFEAGGSDPRACWDYSPGVLALGLVRLGEET